MFDIFSDPRLRNHSTKFPARTIDAPWGDDEIIILGTSFDPKAYWFVEASINGNPKKKYLIENGRHYFEFFESATKDGFVVSKNVNEDCRDDTIYSLYWYENKKVHRNGKPASCLFFGEDKSYTFRWVYEGVTTSYLEANLIHEKYNGVYSIVESHENNPNDEISEVLSSCMHDFWEHVKCVQ
jgi:hypothetical protein